MYQATFCFWGGRGLPHPCRSAFGLPLRKEVIVERYCSCKLGEEVKYDTQGKTPFPSGPLAAILSPPPQMAGQKAHHFTSACQQPCCSELCARRQKGPGRAVGGQYGSSCTVSNELEPVAVVERSCGFTWPSEYVCTFFFFFFLLLFPVMFYLKPFAVLITTQQVTFKT